MNISVGETVRKAEALGEEQYKKFVEERLVKCEKPITDILSKNKLPLFSRPSVKCPSRQKMQIATLKNDCNLFSHLYISCQTRDGDLDKFFTYENQATPPSLSQGCKIRLGTKADLLHSLPIEENQTANAPVFQGKFLDGAAVLLMLNTGTASTFQQYFDTVFYSYITTQLQTVQRVDVVFDTYIQNSLKSTTRQKRGRCVGRRVASTTVIPKNWKDFLQVDENKIELFRFLSQEVIRLPTEEGKTIYSTIGTEVLCSLAAADVSSMAPCSHEEADTRLFCTCGRCCMERIPERNGAYCRYRCCGTSNCNV